MSARVPVYLTEEQIKLIRHGLSKLDDEQARDMNLALGVFLVVKFMEGK
jgi:hypothetical protein